MFSSFGLLSLVMISILSFVVITQSNNSAEIPITNNSIINKTYTDLLSNLSSTQTQTETASSNFVNITPTQQYGELEVTSIVSPTRIVKTMIIGLWNIFIKGPMIIFGVSPVIAALISSILTIFLIIGIWAIWKGVISG